MWPWGGLGLSVDRWQALAISSFDQLHLVQNFEWRWNLLSLESTKESWKGISAQVATQNVCDLCVSAVHRESSCPNFDLHSQMIRANSFSWPCILGAHFSVLTPGVDEIGNDSSVRSVSPAEPSVCHSCSGAEVDSQVTAVCGLSEVPEKSNCLVSKLSWFLNW